MEKLYICFTGKSQMISAFDWWQREHSTTHQSFFIEGKRENGRFFKNDTPIHSEISSNSTPFWSFSGVFFSTQKFFRSSNPIAVAFKTCAWCHIFLTRCLGGLQVPPIFLLKLKLTKNVILKSRVSVNPDLKFRIYWILLNFLTSTAPKKFFMRRNITWWVSKSCPKVRALQR